MQNFAMLFFLRSPQTHLRIVSRSMSVLESRLVPAFAANPSSSSTPGRHLSSVSRRFLPDFASRPVSESSHCRTNGLSLHTSTYRFSTLVNPEEAAVQSRIAKLKRQLRELRIDADDNTPTGQQCRLMCPKCEGGSSAERSLSLFISPDWSSAKWKCFRAKCGYHGSLRAEDKYASASEDSQKIVEKKVTVETLQLEPLGDELLYYFEARKISVKTLDRNRVMQKRVGDEFMIAFTYWQRGELVSCKYRFPPKKFFQEKDTRMIFYGIDDIEKSSEIIIVQGEMDKLAMEEAGFLNCVSVPVRAPESVSEKTPPESMDTKYKFLWSSIDYLKKASRIVIATDGDGPGQALAEEVARRLGKEKCYLVKWPKRSGDERMKDANEVLARMGPDSLFKVVQDAEPYPVQGLFPFSTYYDEIDSYYQQQHGDELGCCTGWNNVDNFYTVVPGELTLVTGVPSSGKSEWIDALLVNLNHSEGWKFALCSMENKVRDHAMKLMEKHVKKPFFDQDYGGTVQRMSREEKNEAKLWLDENFHLIRSEMDSLPSVDWVLARAKSAVVRYGIQGLVIDPYNDLDHQRTNQTETEYVSQMITKIKRFAEHNACHIWLVAHPKQLQQWDGGAPSLYDVSGSAHFINKCDNGIIIHRNRDENAGPLDLVQVCVRKVRNKVAGYVGDAYLSYDRATGLYSESVVRLRGEE